MCFAWCLAELPFRDFFRASMSTSFRGAVGCPPHEFVEDFFFIRGGEGAEQEVKEQPQKKYDNKNNYCTIVEFHHGDEEHVRQEKSNEWRNVQKKKMQQGAQNIIYGNIIIIYR